jgi:hypothetical protein
VPCPEARNQAYSAKEDTSTPEDATARATAREELPEGTLISTGCSTLVPAGNANGALTHHQAPPSPKTRATANRKTRVKKRRFKGAI